MLEEREGLYMESDWIPLQDETGILATRTNTGVELMLKPRQWASRPRPVWLNLSPAEARVLRRELDIALGSGDPL